jgi:hypothetical protein
MAAWIGPRLLGKTLGGASDAAGVHSAKPEAILVGWHFPSAYNLTTIGALMFQPFYVFIPRFTLSAL